MSPTPESLGQTFVVSFTMVNRASIEQASVTCSLAVDRASHERVDHSLEGEAKTVARSSRDETPTLEGAKIVARSPDVARKPVRWRSWTRRQTTRDETLKKTIAKKYIHYDPLATKEGDALISSHATPSDFRP